MWQRHACLACGECCLTGESGRDIRTVCGDANLPEVMASISLKVVSICIHSCSASHVTIRALHTALKWPFVITVRGGSKSPDALRRLQRRMQRRAHVYVNDANVDATEAGSGTRPRLTDS